MGSVVSAVLDPFTGASGVRDAANTAADQQRQAGLTAANISAFRPVGMTTRFGTSQFTREIDPNTGVPYISGASYEAAPELANLQNQLFGQFGGSYNQAQQMAGQYAPLTAASNQLFNLGSQYLAESPEAAAANYMRQQQGLLAGGREQQLANVRNSLFQTGRSGLATGGTSTGMQATNPELAAYYNAVAQQDAQLAAQAQQQGMAQTQYGASLFGTGAGLLGTQVQGEAGAYAPLQTQLGLSGQVEQMSQMPYQLGLQLGTAQTPGQQVGSQQYYGGQAQGAATQYGGAVTAQNMNNQFLSSLIGSAAGAYGGGAAGGMFSTAGMSQLQPGGAFTGTGGSSFRLN